MYKLAATLMLTLVGCTYVTERIEKAEITATGERVADSGPVAPVADAADGGTPTAIDVADAGPGDVAEKGAPSVVDGEPIGPPPDEDPDAGSPAEDASAPSEGPDAGAPVDEPCVENILLPTAAFPTIRVSYEIGPHTSVSVPFECGSGAIACRYALGGGIDPPPVSRYPTTCRVPVPEKCLPCTGGVTVW